MAKGQRHKDCLNPKCPLYSPPGHYANGKGYFAIHQRTSGFYKKYLHRWVIAVLSGKDPGPEVEVHHQDFNQQNCCPYNLVVMDKAIHQSFENSSRRQATKGVQGFQRRPGQNEEIDKLVVEMIAEEFRWPKPKGQQGLFGEGQD